MRVETNEKLIKRNRLIANVLFFFSMAVLIGGFIVANTQLTAAPATPGYALALLLPWVILPVGFISTLVSVRMTNQWVRRPHPDEAIQEGLKGLSKRSVLYNYYHMPARHVIIAPQGVFAIITRFQDGAYSINGDQWKSSSGMLGGVTRIFRQDGIGKPTEDAIRAAAHVKKLLEPTMPGIEVQPLVVFVDPRARLEITNPTVPVLYSDVRKEPNLRDYMRDINQQRQQEETAQAQAKKKGSDKGKTGEIAKAPSPEAIADALEEVTVIN